MKQMRGEYRVKNKDLQCIRWRQPAWDARSAVLSYACVVGATRLADRLVNEALDAD